MQRTSINNPITKMGIKILIHWNDSNSIGLHQVTLLYNKLCSFINVESKFSLRP